MSAVRPPEPEPEAGAPAPGLQPPDAPDAAAAPAETAAPDPAPPAAAPRRRRGAQPGNRNAAKLGFYSRVFEPGEIRDLEQLSAGLESEIAALRVWARRLQEAALEQELDLERGERLVAGLGRAFTRIARLMREQQRLSGGAGGPDAAINQALEQVLKELTCARAD